MKKLFNTKLILTIFMPISAGLGVFAMVCALSTGVGWAQDAPAYPAGLDDPSIDLEELQLRLIPLTVDQLGSLAGAWQEQAPLKEPMRRRCAKSGWRFWRNAGSSSRSF
jgi:hypothetical protein